MATLLCWSYARYINSCVSLNVCALLCYIKFWLLTLLNLQFQAHGDRYLQDLTQYAIGVLHIITLVPFSRKFLVQGTLSSNRVGVAVLLDVVKSFDCVDPEVRFYLSNMN
jgi:hypothetical protein